MSATPHTASVRADDLGRLHEYSSLEILRTAAVIEHFATQVLKEYGLTITQYNVLRILRGAGTEGLCRNEVGRRMIAPMPDATRLIDRLIAAGYAKKGKDPYDMRFTITRITDEGLTLLASLDQPIRDAHTCLMRHLSEEDLNHLSTMLTFIRNQP